MKQKGVYPVRTCIYTRIHLYLWEETLLKFVNIKTCLSLVCGVWLSLHFPVRPCKCC